MTFLKKNWCLMIIAVLLFLLVYTIYTSSIPLPDVVNHVDDHITVGFSQIERRATAIPLALDGGLR